MKLTELLNAPWAMLPSSIREIQEIYAVHCKGDKIDIAAVEARLGRPLASNQQAYTVREGGIAVLSVEGILAPKANLFMQISGGTSAQMLVSQIQSAAADSRVKGLVQLVDSPGGSVFGTPEWAAVVKELATVKPVVTVSDATIASAAYWGGAAANAVYLTGPTVHAGSIGVYSRMALSQPDPGGVEFTRGKFKRGGLNGQAPSAEFMAYFEGQLDHMYSVFVEAIADYRSTSIDAVLETMADGRVFIGQQAIDAGLADGFATVDQIVEQMATNPAPFKTRRKAVFAQVKPSPTPAGAQSKGNQPEPVLLDLPHPELQGNTMDRATLEQQHPALFAQLQSEFTATATAAGASAERQRVADVRAQSLPGHEALVEAMANDGKTTGPQAAAAVLSAERTARTAAAAAHAADAPPAAKHAPAPHDKPENTAQTLAKSAVTLFRQTQGA